MHDVAPRLDGWTRDTRSDGLGATAFSKGVLKIGAERILKTVAQWDETVTMG